MAVGPHGRSILTKYRGDKMFDINFIQKTMDIKKDIINGQYSFNSNNDIFQIFEKFRANTPYIFNIETTNNCNMSCVMCPRTKLMNRKITLLNDSSFDKLVNQITFHSKKDLLGFFNFVESEYGITKEEQSENAFYFYVISQALVLHGYGEPLLDPNIHKRIQSCSDRNIPTYFSCVPANIRHKQICQLFESGLDYIKFAIDALDDQGQKAIRGKNNNFQKSFDSIIELIKYKDMNPNINTQIIITMLSFAENEDQIEQFIKLWSQYPVYYYIKSTDNRWYYQNSKRTKNRSHYISQYCEFPWTSLTVMSNGIVVPCTQDYNAEMVMGNIFDNSLEEIWNSKSYKDLRQYHINGNFPDGYKCKKRCDLPKVFERLA